MHSEKATARISTPHRRSLGQIQRRTSFSIAVTLALLTGNSMAEWQNALKPVGESTGQFMVVKDGQPLVGIMCPKQATTQDKKAAVDLQTWIKEITGATLEISFGKARGKMILIRTDPTLGNEGYAITNRVDQLLLAGGKTRGVINAVYALLEEDLGCRFYASASIRLPKTNTLVINPINRRYQPSLKLRDPFYSCAFDPEWSLRNRTCAPSARVPEEFGGRMDYDGMFVHTAEKMVPPAKYFATHPDYFAQLPDGTRSTAQLCATHPAVAQLAIEFVKQVLKANPHAELVSVSKNDNTTVCHCERCAKLRAEEGSDMANQLILVNRVAEAIETEHPDVTIDTLAYLVTIQVPKTIRPRKNVAIRLCNDDVGSWQHPFTPAEQCDIAKLLTAWSAVHDRIYIWDYNVNFSHYLAPMPNLDVMAANIRFWITNHAEGVMLQGGYQGPAERDELKSWVTSKLLWDPSRDEKALTQDLIWGHYGVAAPALAEYELLLNQIRVDFAEQMNSPKGGIRYRMDAPFLTKEFLDQAMKIFARAKNLAKGDEVLTRRVERAELPILYAQCVRGPDVVGEHYAKAVEEFERIARREQVTHLREGGSDFEKKLAEYKSRITKPATGH